MNDYLIGFSIGAIIVLVYLTIHFYLESNKWHKEFDTWSDYFQYTSTKLNRLEKEYAQLYDAYNYKAKAYKKLLNDYNELLERFKNKIWNTF